MGIGPRLEEKRTTPVAQCSRHPLWESALGQEKHETTPVMECSRHPLWESAFGQRNTEQPTVRSGIGGSCRNIPPPLPPNPHTHTTPPPNHPSIRRRVEQTRCGVKSVFVVGIISSSWSIEKLRYRYEIESAPVVGFDPDHKKMNEPYPPYCIELHPYGKALVGIGPWWSEKKNTWANQFWSGIGTPCRNSPLIRRKTEQISLWNGTGTHCGNLPRSEEKLSNIGGVKRKKMSSSMSKMCCFTSSGKRAVSSVHLLSLKYSIVSSVCACGQWRPW